MIHTLKKEQVLPVTLKQAWDFFATPRNLNLITPDDLQFRIISELPEKMYRGQLICYLISPYSFIKLNWVTEISEIEENRYFIDRQLVGPYKLWHHQHHFEEIAEGVRMTDILHFAMPFGIFGKLAYYFSVRKKLDHIFNYRQRKLAEIFG